MLRSRVGLLAVPVRLLGGWQALALVGGFVALTAILIQAVTAFAVNILFSDQWAMYFIVEGRSFPDIFLYQYGPHRLGLGGIATAVVAWLSGWDSRAESLFIATNLVIAAGLALVLKARLTRGISAFDIVIPALFLSLKQFENLTITPISGHSVLPVLLLVGFAAMLTVGNPAVRYPVLVCLAGVATYTGFGLVLGLLAPVALLAQLRKRPEEMRYALAAAGIAAAIAASFLAGYHWDPAVDCSGIPSIVDWLHFVVTLHALPLGFHYESVWVWPVGGAILAHTLLVTVLALRGGPAPGPGLLPVMTLALASLLFAVLTASGRVCMGGWFANSSRYVTLMLPAIVAVYLSAWLVPPPGRWRVGAAALVGLPLLWASLAASASGAHEARFWTVLKQAWGECYLRSQDVKRCNEWTRFRVWPNSESEVPGIEQLRSRQLSLFNPPSELSRHGSLVPAEFDSGAYATANPTVARSGQNPMYHYVVVARRVILFEFPLFPLREEPVLPPGFVPELYLAANPDVKAAGAEPVYHYLVYGKQEGRPLRP